MTTLIAIVDEPIRRTATVRHTARSAATAVVIVGSALLLFARLGQYAPWDDEAITAMTARAVWQTGDTSARVDDHNLLIYRNGLLVRDLKDRFTPPLQFYVLAPVIGLLGEGNVAIRLPFAACGAITVAILLRWLWRAVPPTPLLWWAAALVLLSNVELFLFCRQCRYYGLAILFTTAAAYLYCYRGRSAWGLSLVLVALLASQYLNYAAAVGCLAVDYAVWGRRDRRFTPRQWVVLIVPQIVVGVVVCGIWNPVARQRAAGPDGVAHHWFADHLRLVCLNVRDAVASDFVVLPLVLAAPLLWTKHRSAWLLRGPAAMAVYIGVISLCVATAAQEAQTAEVRYLAPMLPLAMAVAVSAVWASAVLRPGPRAVLLILSAGSVLIGTGVGGRGPTVMSDPLSFYAELVRPQAEPYTPTIAWVNQHVPAGASVYVAPEYMAYPLMFRAGGPTYAWQLPDPPRADFVNVPAVHVRGRVAPDYIIQFGSSRMAQGAIDARHGVAYTLVATIPVYWQDTYRPERVWRSFTTTVPRDGEAVYVYRRVGKRPG